MQKPVEPKKILCIHDLSGVGRCSLAVILPVLSVMGFQPVALPTVVLSTHTGGLGTPARMDGSAYGMAALEHYQTLGLQFDCIYTGYLGGEAQVALAEKAFALWPAAYKVVDPVMGDNGKAYSTVTPALVERIRSLCRAADLILPNYTEAQLLLQQQPVTEQLDDAAAQALADYFGTIPQYKGGVYDAWVVKDTENKEWKLMSDGSIRAERKTLHGYEQTNNRQYKVEMVSPKLTYAELPKFQECVRQIRHAGAKVNSSCGLHIHVAPNHNRQSLKNLLSIMYAKEDILFKALQVNEARAARWCQKVREPMLRQARTLSAEETKDLTQLESIWYEGEVSAGEHYNWTRYYALNLHSVFYRGTVEWRCFNSTLHAGRAAAYINLCLAMSAQAIAQRSTVMRKTHSDNELFTFRVWLVRLGLNGPEFKNTRDHLLANLDGDRAWRYDKDSYEVNKKKKKNREMER